MSSLTATEPAPTSRLARTRDPLAVVAWNIAILAALGLLVLWPISPVMFEPEGGESLYLTVPTLGWYGALVDQHGLEVTWALTALIGTLTSALAVLLAPRTVYTATVLAVLPYLTVLLLGLHSLQWLIALAVVAVVVALRDPLAGLLPTILALGATWLVLPYFFWVNPSSANPVIPTPQLVATTIAVVAAYLAAAGVGVWVRGRRATAAAQAATSQASAVESLAAERARISRDLHDVVAHHVSLVAVRAESAPFQHPDLDPVARDVLADIAADARAALGELRHVLTVLQRSESTELAPQPTADDVDALVLAAVAAGQEIEVSGGWDDVAPGVGYVLYRATQEALTNARRHAPGAVVTLEREQDEDEVVLRVGNPVEVDATGAAAGRGLIGMRERVEAVDGTLETSVAAGRFTLVITIPTDEP